MRGNLLRIVTNKYLSTLPKNTVLSTNIDVFYPDLWKLSLLSSADNLCKQFGPRSGPTKCWAISGSKLFDTPIAFLKDLFKKLILKKSADGVKKHA